VAAVLQPQAAPPGDRGVMPYGPDLWDTTDHRKTMEQGIADNVLEMALRGKPREPFYMVGRMEGQSVVLRAEKGKLRLMVDDLVDLGSGHSIRSVRTPIRRA